MDVDSGEENVSVEAGRALKRLVDDLRRSTGR